MNIIDSHLHLFNLEQGKYHWLSSENPPFWPEKHRISHSFNERDLQVDPPLFLSGFVHVEAGFDNKHPWKEIEWLQSHCNLPFRSIAYADLSGPFTETLARLDKYPSVVGIRNILEKDKSKLLSQSLTCELLEILAEKKWIFEIGFDPGDSLATDGMCKIMERLPELEVVVDHAGLAPDNAEKNANLLRLASFKNCSVKCSGWEMVAPGKITPTNFFRMARDGILKMVRLFGEERVMLGSNFPVCLLSCRFPECWNMYVRLLEENVLTPEQWHLLSFHNAKKRFGFFQT